MRPRRLELTAFGPFAGHEVVDFDVLAPAGVFLVAGPTGAGKTSLLDGICYALYGSVPGGRQARRLRSDHAAPATPTSVALEFSLRGQDWRVTRQPPHERAKKVGAGVTEQKPTATLSRHGDDGWEPACSGVEEVGRAVRALVGLDAEQFAQVVVLPQGEVQRALLAAPREREALLSSVFSTGRFSALTRELADRATTCEREVTRGQDALDRLRREVSERASGLLGADAGDLPPTSRDDDAAGTRDEDAVIEAWRAAAACHVEVMEGAVTAARRDALEAEAGLRDTDALMTRHARRDAALERRATLERRRAEVEQLSARLDRSIAAAPLRELVAERDQALAERSEAEVAHAAALAALAETPPPLRALDAPDSLAAELASWPEAPPSVARAEEVAAALAEERGRIQALAERGARLDEERRDRDAAIQTAESAKLRVAAAQRHLASATEAHDHAVAARDTAREAAALLPGARASADRLAAQATAAEQLGELITAAAAARDAAQDARQRWLDGQGYLHELRTQQLEGMAGVLARELRDGEPCQVCGALDHPDPAGGAGLVEASEVEEAADEAERHREAYESADRRRDAAERTLELTQAVAGEAADDPVEARQRAVAAAGAAAVHQEAAAALDEREQDVTRLSAAMESADAETRKAAADHVEAATRAGELRTRVAAEEAALVAQLGGSGDPQQALAALDASLAAVRRVVAATLAYDDTTRGLADRERRAHELAVARGFLHIEEAAAACLDVADQDTLRAELSAHQREDAAVTELLADPELHDLGDRVSAEALDAARQRAAAAREQLETAVAANATAVAEAEELALAMDRLRATRDALAPRAREAARVRRLASLCSGTRDNALRMSLERYVLAAALEDVAARASVRLHAMSDGRYTLRHSDARVRGGGASGLSLVVADAWTGVTRDVATLSGGETFQASLAFALGLADAVTSASGGVHLDALFIDEGFGSLDPEALDQAMAELDRLREGGRIVGVISHVPALQERLLAGIRVERHRDGSRVRTLGLVAV